MSLKLLKLQTETLNVGDWGKELKYIPTHVELHLTCSAPVVSALRRMIISEMPRIHFYAKKKDVETTDEFIIPEMIAERIGMIAIDQNTKSTKLFLDVHNTSDQLLKVYSGQLKTDSGPLPCNPTYELFHLYPGKTLKLEAKIRTTNGYAKRGGCVVVASGVSSVVSDESIIFDEFTGTGIRGGESDHKNWILKFDTVGTMSPKDIIRSALMGLDNLLKDIHYASQNAEKKGDEYIFSIDGHTYSAQAIAQYEIATNESIAMVVVVDESLRQCNCRMRGGDPADFLEFDGLKSDIVDAISTLQGL